MEETETAADSPAESPLAQAQTPRLSILHLLLWTICTAVYLSLIRALDALQGSEPTEFVVALQITSSVIQGIFSGAALAGAIVLVSTRVRCGRRC